MKALNKFGFMADIDYPGRIVANIGSPAMQAYMENYGITFDNLFEIVQAHLARAHLRSSFFQMVEDYVQYSTIDDNIR